MTAPLPPLYCRHCGACEVPHVAAGSGPHTARLDCKACGAFVKWAAKALISPRPPEKEPPMLGGINKVILCGAISPRGVEVRFANSGAPCASFMLVVTEQGSDGKPHQLWQPVEVWGKRAEQVGALDAGALVVVDGKLKRVKKGEQYETVITAWDCAPLQMPMAATATHNN